MSFYRLQQVERGNTGSALKRHDFFCESLLFEWLIKFTLQLINGLIYSAIKAFKIALEWNK